MIKFRTNILLVLVFLININNDIKGQINLHQCFSSLRAEQTDDAKVKLLWDFDDFNNSFLIERKSETEHAFITIAEFVRDGEFIDTNAEIGQIYTYKLTSSSKKWEINVGFEVPRVDYRGRLLLLVEENTAINLKDKIDQWIKNAEGDGWTIIQHSISKTATIVEVKEIIKQEYTSTEGLQSIFIFGDLAVPYSGSIALDGHTNHQGGWPADVFYADMNENWTDNTVNVTFNSPRTNNIPGDGKYDNNTIDAAELEIGRVDLANMTFFEESEFVLLEKYLNKNNDYKKGIIRPKMQAFSLDKLFGSDTGCDPSRYFPNLTGKENFKTGNFRTALTSDSYLFANGTGGGTYTSAANISNSQNMAMDSLQAIFTSAFGSYFGDWDVANNYLKAHLCSGTILTSVWDVSKYNNMALGNTIGYDLKSYHSDPQSVRAISLLGDPTLRMQMGNPITEPNLSFQDSSVTISWQYEFSDIDRILQFNIYRKSKSENKFNLIAQLPNDLKEFIDDELTESGATQYMIRAEYLETSPSGTYYNQGIGNPSKVDIPFIDKDGDGYDSFEDCNDLLSTVNPKMNEILDNNIDDNCNGIVDEEDFDQDGFYDYEDCNDQNPNINPNAEEIINNGIDENCDGIDDLDAQCYTYFGIPQKTYFNKPICDDLDDMLEDFQIKPNDAFVFNGEDTRSYSFSFCDGYDETTWKSIILVYPYNNNTGEQGQLMQAIEDCQVTFKIDLNLELPDFLIVVKDKNNCHLDAPNLTLNGFLKLSCAYIDEDQDGFYDYQDCDDLNANVNPDQIEIPFNLLDDDCNENTLDNDGDQDGFPVTNDCDDNNPTIHPGALEIPDNMIDDNCNGLIDEIDNDGDGFPPEIDCVDSNAAINPAAYDYPNNGIDEDCDGIEFEVDSCTYYFFGPYDDFGDIDDFCGDEPISSGYQARSLNSYIIKNLVPNTGYVFSFCEDFDFNAWSPLITIVQYNVVTEETGEIIDGEADCEISFDFPWDRDFPDILVIIGNAENCMGTSIASSISHYTFSCQKIDADNDGFYAYEDCDDTNPNINPDSDEVCDNIDNDCDGYIDEGLTISTYYFDEDGDGFGDDNQTIDFCRVPENYAIQGGDCDDTNLSINPDQSELVYNGIDDDCNPTTLDDDLDQDGFLLADDCDDSNPMINPDQDEIIYNGIDDDCDPTTLDDDLDQDGFLLADDCDDSNPDINPDAIDIPNNGIDEDCDGSDLLTSTYELSNASISIFPNPTIDNVNIEIQGSLNYSITIYNLDGQFIKSGINARSLNLESLRAGIYLLSINDMNSKQKIVERIIKLD